MDAHTVGQKLSAIVDRDPEAPALLLHGDEIAYRVLDRRSSQLARVLIDRGVGPGDIVAVMLPRSVDQVVAAWSVQKAGAACLFAGDLNHDALAAAGATFGIASEPVADSQIRWLALGNAQIERSLVAASERPVFYADRVRKLKVEHPAFVIPTKGGTAFLSQREALALAEYLRVEYAVDHESTTYTSYSSGRAAVFEFLASTTAGAVSVLPSSKLGTDLVMGQVTHWFIAPSGATDPPDENMVIVIVEENL
ncbi:AMP-binding protein [Nocardia sp. NPDC051929]|uniref:AMP-binding protein n=1 Tax=Nocardia sp. NPDC051929 TaxID=3364327 RepID=UPI0037C83CFE